MPEKLADEEIKTIQEMWKNKHTIDEIEEATGRSRGVIAKYIHVDEKPKQPPNIQPAVEPQPAKPVQQPPQVQLKEAKPILPPYPEMQEPHEWLRNFLDKWRLKEPFIHALEYRVNRTKELPTPPQLMADIKDMDSGQTNLRQISAIVDEYYYDLEEYLKKRNQYNQSFNQPRGRGIPIPQPQPTVYYDERTGIPIYREQYPYPPSYPPQNPYYPERQGIPVASQGQSPPYQTIEQELDRLARIQQLLGRAEEKNPMMERYEQDNQELKQRIQHMEEERQHELQEELQSLRMQYHQESQKRKDLEEQIRKFEFQNAQKGEVTEMELKHEELKDRHALEMRKLDEEAKRREGWTKAMMGGIQTFGQAFAKTMVEAGGGEEKYKMEGYYDGRHTWQSICPFCNTAITAPIDQKTIMCPGCNRQLEMTNEENPPLYEKPIMDIPRPRPVEQPAGEDIANCPICHKPMKLPIGVNLFECPHCGKRLQRDDTTNNISSDEQAQVGQFTVEQEIEPTIEQNKEISPQFEKIISDKKDIPDWRTQVKEPKKKSTIEKLEKIETIQELPVIEPEEEQIIENVSKPLEESQDVQDKFVCPECKKSFDQENQLKGHMLYHIRMKKRQQIKIEKK